MKYRLVKKTYVSGCVRWTIEKKVLWWWEYADSSCDEIDARKLLARLRSGVPEVTREIIRE